MARNDFGEEARTAQDVDVPGIKLPETSHHTGRGGAANMYTPNEAEQRDAKNNNERVRSSSFQKARGKAEESVKALADKARAAVKGGKDGKDASDDSAIA
jgi:hypothetical protein